MSIVNISNKYWLGIFIVICLLLFVIMLYVIFGALKLKSKFFQFLTSTYKVWLVLMISTILFGSVFSVACSIKSNNLVNINGKVDYSGVITNCVTHDNYVQLELRDVTYEDSEYHKLKSNLNVVIYTKGSVENFEVGNKLTGSGYISKAEFVGYNVYNYSAVYSTTAQLYDVDIEKGNPNIFENIKLSTKHLLNNNMSSENASIAYAMLFGEKDGISKNIYNIFSIAGISHILAVSGLHIGVLVAILLLIFKKCKVNKPVTFVAIGAILIVYNIICGFSNSVVRASVMAMILLGANLFGKQYDSLSSLSLAGIIICLFNPFAMFSVGFQLSFTCVFAIITLMPTINRGFQSIKFDNGFTKTLSMSMATSIALIPFCAHYFGRISLLTVLTNIVIVPIFSFSYVILFAFVLIGLILNFMGVLLIVPNLIIHFIKLIANFVAGLKYSYVLVFDISVITFVLVLSMQYIIQFMVGSKVFKGVVLSIFALSIVVSLVFDFMPKTYSQNQIISFNQYYGNMVVMTNNEDVTIVGYNYRDYDRLSILLKQHKINKIENVILYDLESSTENLEAFIFDYKVSHLYMPKNFKFDQNIDTTIHIVESQFTLGSTTCSYIEKDNVVGVAISYNNAITIVGNNFKRSDLDHIGDIYRKGVSRIIVNKVEYDFKEFVACEEIISQSNNNYYSNIVLDNEKMCYSYI